MTRSNLIIRIKYSDGDTEDFIIKRLRSHIVFNEYMGSVLKVKRYHNIKRK